MNIETGFLLADIFGAIALGFVLVLFNLSLAVMIDTIIRMIAYKKRRHKTQKDNIFKLWFPKINMIRYNQKGGLR
jgi:hypothetical protein